MDDPVLRAIELDDSLRTERVLSSGPGGTTELVRPAAEKNHELAVLLCRRGIGADAPLVRKRIPADLANRDVWESLSGVDCPRVPHVLLCYELPDDFVAVLEYVPGQTLEELVTERGPLSPGVAARLTGEVCEAAAALHARGVVHRDISPRNVVVDGDGAHLIDCGIARVHEEGASHDTTMLGTWGFASPEQYGFAQTDARSDVYSIGRLLVYMLAGVGPDDPTFEARVSERRRDAAALCQVADRASAFEPSARYQDVVLMGEDVAKAAPAAPGAADCREIAAGVTRAAATSPLSGRFRIAWRKPVAVVWGVAAGLGALTFALAAVSMLVAPAYDTDRLSWVLAVLLAWFFAFPVGRQGVSLILRRGAYGEGGRPLATFVRRLAMAAVAVVAASFAVALVVSVVWGNSHAI